MVQVSLPHLNVLTKCDKIGDPELVEKIIEQTSCKEMMDECPDKSSFFSEKFYKLN